MSSGIFGPRAPSYLPPSSNYFAQGTSAYSVGSLPPTTLYPVNPYSASPAGFWYSGALQQSPHSIYPYAPQHEIDISTKGLEAILVAILVLVSLDLAIIRPLKQGH